jgi:hypothetical protein
MKLIVQVLKSTIIFCSKLFWGPQGYQTLELNFNQFDILNLTTNASFQL